MEEQPDRGAATPEEQAPRKPTSTEQEFHTHIRRGAMDESPKPLSDLPLSNAGMQIDIPALSPAHSTSSRYGSIPSVLSPVSSVSLASPPITTPDRLFTDVDGRHDRNGNLGDGIMDNGVSEGPTPPPNSDCLLPLNNDTLGPFQKSYPGERYRLQQIADRNAENPANSTAQSTSAAYGEGSPSTIASPSTYPYKSTPSNNGGILDARIGATFPGGFSNPPPSTSPYTSMPSNVGGMSGESTSTTDAVANPLAILLADGWARRKLEELDNITFTFLGEPYRQELAKFSDLTLPEPHLLPDQTYWRVLIAPKKNIWATSVYYARKLKMVCFSGPGSDAHKISKDVIDESDLDPLLLINRDVEWEKTFHREWEKIYAFRAGEVDYTWQTYIDFLRARQRHRPFGSESAGVLCPVPVDLDADGRVKERPRGLPRGAQIVYYKGREGLLHTKEVPLLHPFRGKWYCAEALAPINVPVDLWGRGVYEKDKDGNPVEEE